MKYLFILLAILPGTIVIGQKRQQLWVEATDVILLQGAVSFESSPELFVGQEYLFTIIGNDRAFDLKVETENLTVVFEKESTKGTGGLRFRVIPIDTGECVLSVSVGKGKKQTVGLLAKFFHASVFPMPPVSISGIRSGGIIYKLPESSELSCHYDESLGIFESYPVKSWKAKIGNSEFSGTGNALSKELIDAINRADNDVLQLFVELEKNKTLYKSTEAVYLVR